MVWYGMVRCDIVWCGMVWCDMVLCCIVWYRSVSHRIVYYHIEMRRCTVADFKITVSATTQRFKGVARVPIDRVFVPPGILIYLVRFFGLLTWILNGTWPIGYTSR